MPSAAVMDFDWNSNSRWNLRNALIVSVLLHAFVLAVRFVPPVPKTTFTPPLEVILVNAQSKANPKDAKVLAQVGLDGGGQADSGRASTTPTESDDPVNQRELKAAQERLAKLESLMREMEGGGLKPKDLKASQASDAQDIRSDTQSQRELEMHKLQAEISDRIREYNERPRKHFFSPKTSPYDFAIYEEGWRTRVEQVGNTNYPEELKGKIYGKLRLTVYIKADGSIDNIEVDRTSGSAVLDRAAIKLLRMSGPFAPFPSEIRQKADILAITRTWVFSRDSVKTEY
jgi:protein TonB